MMYILTILLIVSIGITGFLFFENKRYDKNLEKLKLNKIRTNKELLKVFLNNQNLFKHGLCHWSGSLYLKDFITFPEYMYIKNLIKRHKPLLYKLGLTVFLKGGYYWKRGNITPRIEWLLKHLQ